MHVYQVNNKIVPSKQSIVNIDIMLKPSLT
jgi:hypothetical protein